MNKQVLIDEAAAPLTDPAVPQSLAEIMAELGQRARLASTVLATAPTPIKNAALLAGAKEIQRRMDEILTINTDEVARGREKGLAGSFLDRLALDPARIEGIISSVQEIARLPDPVGDVIASWQRPNGLEISRVRTPLGVIGVIFESRPNVGVDAGALCLKAGNSTILRPGSDSYATSDILAACMISGVKAAGLPTDALQLVPSRDRAAVGEMLAGLDGNLDVIVPRGGRSLVERVQREARVPIFAHLDGICHVYVHAPADIALAREIVVNAKMRRTGTCGAAETILLDRAHLESHGPLLVEALVSAGCEVRADAEICALAPGATPADPADFGKEFLDSIVAMKVVDGLAGAKAHIALHGSGHTDCIVTEDDAAAEDFLATVDSAIVMRNASTQFADGGEFGMGAEIGIATGRMHARGPVGLEQLTSFKYQVRGTGQTRA